MIQTKPYNNLEDRVSLLSLLIWLLTLLTVVCSVIVRGIVAVFSLLVKWTSKIVFYSILILCLISAFLVFCSLYVITFGSLHIP